MYYKDEKTNIVVDIFLLGIAVVVLMVVYGCYKQFINGDLNLSIFLIIEGMLFMWLFLIMYLSLNNIINSKHNKRISQKIKNNGLMVRGNIVDIVLIEKYNYKDSIFKCANGFVSDSCTCVKVKYNYNGNDFTVITPRVMFCKSDILSDDVDVYVYNNMVYIDNFKVDFENSINNSK